MTDIFDRAQELEEFDRERAIERALGKAHTRGPDDILSCVDCDDPIDPERRQVKPGCLRCVECEARRERRLCQFRNGAA